MAGTSRDHADRLSALVADQCGLFTRAQAKACGYSAARIRRRTAAGDWQRVLGPVLGGAGVRVTPALRDRAALLAVPAAVLVAASAARLHGVDVPDRRTWLAVAPAARVRLPGISVSRERLPTGDVIFVDGLLVTTRERAVLDCLRRLPPRAAAELLDRALQQRWITQDWLVGRVHDFAGRPGVGRLVRLVRDCGDGARSAAERLLVRELRAAGIGGWVANHPVYDARGALVGVVDLAFVARRLAVEVDGRAWHSAGDRFQRDRERQNRLVAAGWTVLRFTWHDLTARPDRVVATIAGLLARSGEEPTGRAATEVPVGAGAPVGSRA